MKRNLDQLIAHWQKQKIITATQATQMRSDIDLDSKTRNKNRFIMALSTLGAVALGVGVILFVSSNWEHLPKAIKLLMAVLLPIVPLATAHWLLMVKKTYLSLGRGAALVGILLIGAALAIIGQLYHLESEYVRFLTVWALLALPFVYWFKRVENVFVLVALIGGVLLALLTELTDRRWLFDDVAMTLMPVIYLAYGGILYSLGTQFQRLKDWQKSAVLLRVVGVQLALVALFVMTFQFYAETVHDGLGWSEVAVRLFLNIFYVGFLVLVLYKAIAIEAEKIISTVFFWFGVFILVRYFDFFWDMLPTSLFFIVGGIIFIGGAVALEKQRKRLLANFDSKSVVNNLSYDD